MSWNIDIDFIDSIMSDDCDETTITMNSNDISYSGCGCGGTCLSSTT